MTPSATSPLRLNVTSLTSYIRLNNCERYLWYRLHPQEEASLRKRWNVTNQPLTPLLKEEGFAFEDQVEAQIRADFATVVSLGDQDEAATIAWLRQVNEEQVVLLQPSLSGSIGRYAFNGVADAIHLLRTAAGLQVYIADIKASRQERTEHRLQIAAYAHLLHQVADRAGVKLASVTGGVLHFQEEDIVPHLDLGQTFDLDTYLTILHHLIIDEDSIVNQVAVQTFEESFYHLGYGCDGCLYNATCMVDSAERKDLSLLPHLTATEKRTLQMNGIQELGDLAVLMDLPEPGQGYELTTAAEHEAKVRELSQLWPVGTKLPILVQRAKRALRRFDRNTRSWSYLPNNSYGTLPVEAEHPGLIKIFFDAQHDYLRNRLYMIAAMVIGPTGEEVIVKRSNAPPTDDSERALLLAWVSEVMAALPKVADRPQVPVHLYCYNSYDQRTLLDALKRHLSTMTLLPGFFDLMTQSPALDQPIISFLALELEERMNLGIACMALHDAARMRGFDWEHDGTPYYQRFRARLFDNRRDVVRNDDGTLSLASDDVPKSDPRRFPIESASRFNSQIPLEYAYAVWGRLPEAADATEKRLLLPFRQVTATDLEGFAAHRVRALVQIEDSFRTKARFLEKKPLDLAALGDVAIPVISLAQALREFLYMEHYAGLQTKLQIYGMPIGRRMQTGEALLLRFAAKDARADTYHFTIACDELDLDPELTLNGLRLKEGDWCVLNPLEPLSANQIKHGRIAVVTTVGDGCMALALLGISFGKGSSFRYWHKRTLEPEPDGLYTLDTMADDLNFDKILESLSHTHDNLLYSWLEQRPASRQVDDAVQQRSERFLDVVDMIERPHKLTEAQRRVIGRLDAPVLLVQGPPGTGKSHTMGWAILNRILQADAEGRSCRVAIACKTHNAVNIVLESVIKKWRKLTGFALPGLGNAGLPGVQVVKLVNGFTDPVPDGVVKLDAYNHKAQAEEFHHTPCVVIGGTPGGLYNLAKYREAGENGSKKVDWALKPFDLLVIDEASQMSVPEAVLAGAFLAPGGSVVVVGDHRQMPPIVAHEWEDEEKQSAVTHEPYLSLFEFLQNRGFPKESLNESFRLHRTIAQFLHENIYVHDGIKFHSRRTDLLDTPLPVDALTDLVMDPNYPIVVIEHGEQRSQQYNETEMALVRPLIECLQAMRLDGLEGVGVVVPHRAQKARLRALYPDLAQVDSIDTVERFQGGERDVIIVSATASDPDYVLAEADFLLNLNRLNVAISRPRKKLIVIASQSVVRLLTSDLDTFNNAVIWKRLYYQYADTVLWNGSWQGVSMQVRGRSAAMPAV